MSTISTQKKLFVIKGWVCVAYDIYDAWAQWRDYHVNPNA